MQHRKKHNSDFREGHAKIQTLFQSLCTLDASAVAIDVCNFMVEKNCCHLQRPCFFFLPGVRHTSELLHRLKYQGVQSVNFCKKLGVLHRLSLPEDASSEERKSEKNKEAKVISSR